MRILLVEDDNLLADGISAALRRGGYTVDWAARGDDADRWLATQEYDLVLLDLGLPGLDGVDVLSRMRKRRIPTPVLVLSARETLDERVRLLDLGADDYIVKPVALKELEARVRVLLRRGQTAAQLKLNFGHLQLDIMGKRVYLNGEAQDFSSREFKVLEILVTRADRIVSKEQLQQSLFGWEEGATLNAVEKSISRLRAKLLPYGIGIRTIRGLGYMMEKPLD
jgi:two-component system OmpR family response regulator